MTSEKNKSLSPKVSTKTKHLRIRNSVIFEKTPEYENPAVAIITQNTLITLVLVSGMSPSIITETVWKLGYESPAVVPDEVVVITTADGSEKINSTLLKPKKGWKRSVWESLRNDIFSKAKLPTNSKKLQLSIRIIEIPDIETGIRKPAKDIRTKNDNDQAANFIIHTLSPLTESEDNHVIASIAGGRKTMGALLYAAMSLVGKETDRVTHVLVNEPYETCRDFFYPTQPLQILEIMKPAAEAVIELADISFVPLRNKFKELDEPRRTFSGLVQLYSRKEKGALNKAPSVELDIETFILKVNGRPIQLSKGREATLVNFLLQRAKNGDTVYSNRDDAVPDLNNFVIEWKKNNPSDTTLERFSGGISIEDINRALNTLREKLEKAGLGGAISYLAPERARVGFEIS